MVIISNYVTNLVILTAMETVSENSVPVTVTVDMSAAKLSTMAPVIQHLKILVLLKHSTMNKITQERACRKTLHKLAITKNFCDIQWKHHITTYIPV